MPSLWASLGLNATAFKAGLDRSVAQAQGAGNRMGSALGGAISGQLAGFVSAAAAVAFTKRIVDYGGQVQDLANRLGISTDAVQEWDYALRMNGATIDQAAGFFQKMARARQDALSGNDKAAASFRRLGISLSDLKTMRLEDIGLKIAAAFKAGDPQALIADLAQIGGRGAGELVAAFRSGFAELVQEARNAGVIIDENIIQKLDQAGDRFERLGMEMRASFAPALVWLSEMATSLWRNLQRAGIALVTLPLFGMKAAREESQKLEQQWKDQDSAAAKKPPPGAGGLPVGDDEPAKEEERRLERIMRLKEQLFDAQRENDLEQLSKEKQLEELARRRAAIVWAMQTTTDEEGRLNAALDVEKIDARIRGIAGQSDSKSQIVGMSTNSLQRIGAYVGDPTKITQLDVSKRSEKHLEQIRDKINKFLEQAEGRSTQY